MLISVIKRLGAQDAFSAVNFTHFINISTTKLPKMASRKIIWGMNSQTIFRGLRNWLKKKGGGGDNFSL